MANVWAVRPSSDKKKMSQPEPLDWIDRIVAIAGSLGFNTIKVRWKLERLNQRWQQQQRRGEQRVGHIRYQHKTCPDCGRIYDRDEKVCSNCGSALGARGWHVLQRIGLSVPTTLSISAILGLFMSVVFVRLCLHEPTWQAIFSFSGATLVRFGGNYAPAVYAGQWWRLGCAIFLHAGVWHIAFNLFALSQVGPAAEEIFGRGRMILFFMLTGILANLGSLWWGLPGVGIGASGAVMGLCGLVAGWGQRDGTTLGRQARNRMLKWVLYTLLFGVFIGADNVAHSVGFGIGALIGFALQPDLLRRKNNVISRVLQTSVGLTLALLSTSMVFVTPHLGGHDELGEFNEFDEFSGFGDMDFDIPAAEIQFDAVYEPWAKACKLVLNGDSEGARTILRRMQNPNDIFVDGKIKPEQNTADNLLGDANLDASSCGVLRAQLGSCQRFAREGMAMHDDVGVDMRKADLETIEQYWQLSCAALKQAIDNAKLQLEPLPM